MEFFGNKAYEKKIKFNGILMVLFPFVLLVFLAINGTLTPTIAFSLTILVVIPVVAIGVVFIKSVKGFSKKYVVIVGDEDVQIFMPFQKKKLIQFKDVSFMKRTRNIIILNKSKFDFLRINLDLVANESKEQLYDLLCERNST